MKKIFLLFLLAGGMKLSAQTKKIAAAEALKHVRDTVTICDKIYGGRYLESSSITLLNLGGAYPNQALTLVIKGKNREKFTGKPEDDLNGKEVCVTGVVSEFKGKAQIEVFEPGQVRVD